MSKNRNDDTQPSVDETLANVSDLVVKFGTMLPKILHWCTKGGAPVISGLFGVYAFLICVESYYRALPVVTLVIANPMDGWENRFAEVETIPAFVPKPGINDGGDIRNLSQAMVDPNFYICLLVALGVQVVESFVQRGKDPDMAKAEYESVKHHQVPTVPNGAITLVQHKADEYQEAGMAKVKRTSMVTWVAYAVDYGAAISAFWQYAFNGLGSFGLSVLWGWVAIYGPETCLGWMEDRLEEYQWFKEARTKVGVPARNSGNNRRTPKPNNKNRPQPKSTGKPTV